MGESSRTIPPITPGMRASARRQPGGWLYAVDPEYDPEGAVPPQGIVGAWRVDDRGEITGEFTHNPTYVPSAKALELPEPTDPLDATLQRAATGRARGGELMQALLDAELWLYAGETPGFFSVPDDGRGKLIYAFSSEEHARSAAPEITRWQRIGGRELARSWPAGHELYLNPGTRVAVRIPGEDLRRQA